MHFCSTLKVCFSTATFIGGRAIVCGGIRPSATILYGCNYYDREIDLWRNDFDLNEARHWSSGVMVTEDEWWISGGRGDDAHPIDSIEVYNNSTGTDIISQYLDRFRRTLKCLLLGTTGV